MMSKIVLITGASGGIGKELADRFAKDGCDLVLVARSEEKLVDLAREYREKYRVQTTYFAKDVALPGVAEEIYRELKEKGITVDFLVNNAGFGLYGEFLETQLEQEINMIDINIKALTVMTKVFLPDMVKRHQGGVLNVASLVAFFPGPLMAVYYATKAYVLSFTEALENELRGTGVTVSALCTGATATGFVDRAGLATSKLFRSGVMEVGQVADIGYREFLRGKTLIITGGRNKFMAFLPRLLPCKLMTNAVRSAQAKVDH
ncbi:short-chain dehydrogenase [Paenibacillus lautus]|uniref:SDR family NAD(P)-dependent oxidoreductase n=1 Tax=Paenibacillus lautus TaxID=1401 RepID=UPI001B07571E|nr:SDR family oxidoreductase [Paenibacillus lautus]GIP00609.1 short-chain dehydrogenase [Paenibacillus lautus]